MTPEWNQLRYLRPRSDLYKGHVLSDRLDVTLGIEEQPFNADSNYEIISYLPAKKFVEIGRSVVGKDNGSKKS